MEHLVSGISSYLVRKYAFFIQIRVKARMLGEKELTFIVTLPRISKILDCEKYRIGKTRGREKEGPN